MPLLEEGGKTKLEQQITQLLVDLGKYKDEIKWSTQDKTTIHKLNAHERVATAENRIASLEPLIKEQIRVIFGEVASIREREKLAEQIELNKIDERLKSLLNNAVEEQVATKSYELIKSEVSDIKNIIRGLPKRTSAVRNIKEDVRSLRQELKNLSRKPILVNLEESETMKGLTSLRKVLANLGKDETEDVYIVYPSTGAKKEVEVGTISIDFLTGDVTLPSGTVEHTSNRLENTTFDFVRSISIDTEKAVVIALDDGTKFEVKANQFYSIPKRKFRMIYITCTETTKLIVYASTNEDSAIRFEVNVQNTDEQRYTTRIAYSGNNPEYIGEAFPGSSAGDAAWRIKKLTYSGDNVTEINWAEGTEKFTNVWSSRTTYTYT